jgi:hypothetical protein
MFSLITNIKFLLASIFPFIYRRSIADIADDEYIRSSRRAEKRNLSAFIRSSRSGTFSMEFFDEINHKRDRRIAAADRKYGDRTGRYYLD